jgi:putative methionine-R-sulfoxide reductase with GAF domain
MKTSLEASVPGVFGRLVAGMDAERVLPEVLEWARAVAGADEASLLTVLPNGKELRESCVTGRKRREAFTLRIGAEGVCGWVGQFRKPAVVPDCAKESRYVRTDASHRSMAALPILEGLRLAGVLALESVKRGHFTKRRLPLLECVASLVATAVKIARLEERDRRAQQQLGMINHLTRLMGTAAPAEFFQCVADELRKSFETYFAAIRIGDYAREEVVLLVSSSEGKAEPVERLKFGTGLTGRSFRLGEVVNAREVSKDPFYVAGVPGIRSELCVPVRTGDHCFGIVDLQSREPARFSSEDVIVVETVARLLAPVMAKLTPR